jgi:hypothetical protein
MKITVFWDVVPTFLTELTISVIRVMMTEAVSSSETSVSMYQPKRGNVPIENHH